MSDEPNDFEQAGQQGRSSIVSEFVHFLRDEKKWWMFPIILMLGLLGALVLFSPTGAGPFIYTLF